MVMAGHFFLGKLEQAVNQYFMHIHVLSLVTDNKVSKGAKIRSRYNQVPHPTQDTNGKVTKQPFLNDSAEGRRMTIEIIS